MADENKKGEEKTVEVPAKLLTQMQEQMAELERKVADSDAKTAGLEEMVAKSATTNDDLKLREKKDFEPKFRTIRVRKYPIAGDENNLGYIVGWTSKGAYQEVDRTGVSPQMVDYIDVIFLGSEKTKEGKLKAEKIKLIDLLNNGKQVHCKILETKRTEDKVPTGEEIDVSVFDPAHGLVTTGDKVDGYSAFSSIQYKIQIPGVEGETWIDALYCNA
jgi:hypothetical protein